MKIKVSLILLSLLTITSIADDFDLDYAVFRGDDANDIVEVYLLIPRGLFEFVKDGEKYQSNAYVRIAFAFDDTVRQMKEWSFSDKINDPTKISDTQKIPEIATMSIPKGNYRIIAILMDLNSKQTFRQEKDINVRDFSIETLDVSDIQLSGQISRTEDENKFSKYFNYDIIPNASNIYGEQHAKIYAFCEIYNLTTDSGQDEYYQVQYSITNINDDIVKLDDWVDKKKPGKSAVEIKSMDISDLSSGLYNFRVAIKEENGGEEIASSKRFYIAKNDHKKLAMDAIDEVNVSMLTEKELNKIFEPLKYFASDKERRLYRKSTVDGKRNIIRNFWKGRDPDPTTSLNEAEYEFQRRLNFVKQQFSSPQHDGWKTDMGRVYLVYGEPSEIERFPSSMQSKPYQIWYYYELEGGSFFIFVDKTGFGTLELVHSTARNELQDENWERWIQPMGDADNDYY